MEDINVIVERNDDESVECKFGHYIFRLISSASTIRSHYLVADNVTSLHIVRGVAFDAEEGCKEFWNLVDAEEEVKDHNVVVGSDHDGASDSLIVRKFYPHLLARRFEFQLQRRDIQSLTSLSYRLWRSFR